MKKIITTLLFTSAMFSITAQTTIDYENFVLPVNSFYHDTNSIAFQTNSVSFPYQWTKGTYPYWSGGFSYTNKYDSSTAGYTNLYGVKPLKGFNNSSIYTVGQDKGVIKMMKPSYIVNGFYYTNTTFAYKSIRNGDSFTRKFGDTTGTKSGTTIAQGSYPDFFKVTVKGYRNGVMKNDSVEFYLADYRFVNSSQDYVVNDWRFLNTNSLGLVDSVKFFMYSSDNSQYGMNTPAFFAIDNLLVVDASTIGLTESEENSVSLYPNPFSTQLFLQTKEAEIKIFELTGKIVYNTRIEGPVSLDLQILKKGMYTLEIISGSSVIRKKLVKE